MFCCRTGDWRCLEP